MAQSLRSGAVLSYVIVIPHLPQSMNVSLSQHWSNRSVANKQWYATVAAYALLNPIPRPAFAHAILEIELRYQVRQRGARKRDASNIVKVTEDALVKCGILVDDSFPHLHETRLRARPATSDQVLITIREPYDHPAIRKRHPLQGIEPGQALDAFEHAVLEGPDIVTVVRARQRVIDLFFNRQNMLFPE